MWRTCAAWTSSEKTIPPLPIWGEKKHQIWLLQMLHHPSFQASGGFFPPKVWRLGGTGHPSFHSGAYATKMDVRRTLLAREGQFETLPHPAMSTGLKRDWKKGVQEEKGPLTHPYLVFHQTPWHEFKPYSHGSRQCGGHGTLDKPHKGILNLRLQRPILNQSATKSLSTNFILW